MQHDCVCSLGGDRGLELASGERGLRASVWTCALRTGVECARQWCEFKRSAAARSALGPRLGAVGAPSGLRSGSACPTPEHPPGDERSRNIHRIDIEQRRNAYGLRKRNVILKTCGEAMYLVLRPHEGHASRGSDRPGVVQRRCQILDTGLRDENRRRACALSGAGVSLVDACRRSSKRLTSSTLVVSLVSFHVGRLRCSSSLVLVGPRRSSSFPPSPSSPCSRCWARLEGLFPGRIVEGASRGRPSMAGPGSPRNLAGCCTSCCIRRVGGMQHDVSDIDAPKCPIVANVAQVRASLAHSGPARVRLPIWADSARSSVSKSPRLGPSLHTTRPSLGPHIHMRSASQPAERKRAAQHQHRSGTLFALGTRQGRTRGVELTES